MITALDHIVLVCPDIDEGVTAYAKVMGQQPVWRARGEGSETALFAIDNTALELLAPSGDGPVATKLRNMTKDGARITSLAYRSDDLIEDHRLFGRRGLGPTDISDGTSTHLFHGETRSWKRFRVPDNRMAGIKSFVLEPNSALSPQAAGQVGSVSKLDHLVINTPNPERAVANYAGRLGLRFALERVAAQWKTHFMFFRLGDLTLEVIHRLGEVHNQADNDTIWGVTWAVDDLNAAHERLGAAGVNVSDIRAGRKPGSRVFTLRDGTLGIPTLFIQHDEA